MHTCIALIYKWMDNATSTGESGTATAFEIDSQSVPKGEIRAL